MTTENDNREARKLLDPHVIRITKKHDGFSEEMSAVDYWDAVKVLSAALSSRPSPATDDLYELLADTLGEHPRAFNSEIADSGEYFTVLPEIAVEELATYLARALASRPSSTPTPATDGQAMWARRVLGMANDEPNEATGWDTTEAFLRLTGELAPAADDHAALIADTRDFFDGPLARGQARLAKRILAALEGQGQK